jgi:hypothetical protein
MTMPKICPRCGALLTLKTYCSPPNHVTFGKGRTIPSSSAIGPGSIEVYSNTSPIRIYVCPNKKCGYLSTDC